MVKMLLWVLFIMKKLLVVFVVAFLGNIPQLSYAYDFQSGGIYYNILDENNVAVTGVFTYKGGSTYVSIGIYEGEIVIPPTITNNGKNYSVTSIGSSAFQYQNVISIMIPNSVTSIGNFAFSSCSDLTSISIPNSVKSIGNYAFSSSSGLTSISIPNSVKSIGEYAFYGCRGLTSISIPNSVTSIGRGAFDDCISLISIKVESGNAIYDSRNNCNAIIRTSNNELITGCKNTVIPNSVTSIGNSAFSRCSGLTFISIPNSVTSIGNYAFYYCSGLTSISIPNSVTSISDYAFYCCSGLTSISIPSSVTSIGNSAFYYCSGLTSISIPNSVKSIGNWTFGQCSGLTSISIPNSVTSIGNYAFSSCRGLSSISIPNSVTSIGNYAFSGCSGLSSISIPNSVTSIGNYAFSGCSGLKDIISEIKTPFEINENVFSVYSTATLTVPNGTKSAYQSTAGWNKFTNIVEKEADNIIQGDANGDKEVNVSDIVEVINYIMDNPSAIFLKDNADLNGDGEVNVTDIVMMVNIIMSAQSSSVRTMSNRAGSMTDGDCLTIDDVNINAGETKQVSINLNNPDKKYTAFQFDLTLPEGIAIAKNSNGKLMASLDAERKDDHTLSVSELGNNSYRFLAFSMSNAELYGTNGPLVNITLQADANMDSGTNAAALKSQVFTATDGTQYKWSDLPFSILVNGSENTCINEISQNGQKGGMIKVYTLTGLLLFSVPQSEFTEKWQALPFGVYIVNGQKMIKTNDSK